MSILEHIKRYGLDEADRWIIPFWNGGLSPGIMPIGATVEDRFIPIGTAFVFSKLGFVASALHNIWEAVTYDRIGPSLRQMRAYPRQVDLKDVGLSVLHSVMSSEEGCTFTIWPLENCDAAPPTDLVFGFPQAQPGIPKLVLPITFRVPRVGSTVYCVGFAGMRFPSDGIPLNEVRSGSFEWADLTSFDLKVTRARVTKILLQGIAASYPTGPCFLVDRETEHGQSGGPVIDEEGSVCGMVSAGCTAFGAAEASAISMLYPALFAELKFGLTMGPVRINATYPLIERIANGDVITDGSEADLVITKEDGVPVVGPKIHKDDHPYVFDDLAASLDGQRATPASGTLYRIRWNDSGDPAP